MKLYWAPHSRAMRALWMLEEAGRPYEREVVNLRAGAQTSEAYRAINPMMKVPALVDGEAAVAETGAVCAYIAERVPEAGLAPPVGDPRRGPYLRWLFFSPMIEAALMQKTTGFDVPSTRAGWGSYERVIDVLEQGVREGPWLLGDDFSAADVLIGSDLNFGVEVTKLIEPRPAFTAYIARCTARPAFRRAQEIAQAEAPSTGAPPAGTPAQ